MHPPLVLTADEENESEAETPGSEEPDRTQPPEEENPLGDFRRVMPQALIDMKLPEDDPKYQQAVNVKDRRACRYSSEGLS